MGLWGCESEEEMRLKTDSECPKCKCFMDMHLDTKTEQSEDKLTVTKRMITDSALLKCPNCGYGEKVELE